MNGILKIILILTLVAHAAAFGQGASLSPHDLKESYLEKRLSYLSSSTKLIASENQSDLDRIVKVLEENAPNSYEYHFVKYVNGNYDFTLKEHLFKAYELKPDQLEVKKEMFAYYVMTDDKGKRSEFAKKIISSYSENTKNYYKLLAANSNMELLFLSGQADAVPMLALQSLGSIRTNLTLVNLDFLANESYRKSIEKKIGMNSIAFLGNEQAFINKAIDALSTKAFFSTTISQNYIRTRANEFYNTGLHYQFNCPNQLEVLNDFWKNGQQNLKALTLNSRSERALYSNFLPPLLTLYKMKLETGDKNLELRNDILVLAKKVGKDKAVADILKAYDQIE